MEKLSFPAFSYGVKAYSLLTKPGIIMGNVITTAGGFALASRGGFNLWLFLATVIGITLVIGSACVFNNYIDREYDKKMDRTKNRAFAKGIVSTVKALTFAAILGTLGGGILLYFVNTLTFGIALFGFLVYVLLYSFSKYYSIHGTLIGSAAGAVPPVIGYTAVSGHLDLGAILLFATIAMWQMPHFFAIALFRLKDYTKAGIPVLPVKKGIKRTKVQMIFYIILFTIASSMLTYFGYTGTIYLLMTLFFGVTWLILCLKGFKAENTTRWARKVFIYSLVIVMGICVAIPFSVL